MKLSPALRVAFIAALAVILGTTAVSYRNAMTLFEESQWVAHTHQVRVALLELWSALQDAELGERGFTVTGDESYLIPYIAAQLRVPQQLRHLRALSRDPEQHQRLANFGPRVDALLGWLQMTIDIRRQQGFEAAQDRVTEGAGKREMDAIRNELHDMEVAENRLLQQRVAAADQAARIAAATFAIEALLSAALIVLLYAVLRQYLRVRNETARERDELLAREQAARRIAEQEHAKLEEANRAKDIFLATVSHELRTPLAPILTWAAMLERGTLDADQTRRGIETIRRCAKAQVQLIEDLLDVSRIVTGKMRLEVRAVDLRTVIRAAVDVVRPAADARNIRLMVLDMETALVAGDPERLQQVVWNLLSNALKFTPRDGSVRVTLKRVGSNVEIVVSDTGQGISPEFLPHVFERFRQDDTSSTRQHSGLGLGLAIVRHIVEAHGGVVDAESPGLGTGSVFTVKLPLMVIPRMADDGPRRHPADTPLTAQPYPALEGLRVLVVDDEADSSEAVRALLSSCGAEVRLAASAAQALDILGAWTPDLLVSDIRMPEEDGYGLIAKLRARQDANAHVPAIALTAYASVEDRARLLSAGFQMHVAKPVEPAELLAVVAHATTQH